MTKLYFLLGVIFAALATPAHAQWATVPGGCPAGTIDALGWETAYPAWRQSNGWWSHANHQTFANMPDIWAMGEIMSAKGGDVGETWEIAAVDANGVGLGGDHQRWDRNYIYFWNTGGGWDSSPIYPSYYYSYYMFDRLIPSLKRCAKPGYPGDKLVTPDSYIFVTDGTPKCQWTADSPRHFGRIKMVFWGPYQIRLGAQSAPQTTYILAYNWGYNKSTGIYEHQEQQYYQQPQGWSYWAAYSWDYKSGSYIINKNQDGSQQISDMSAVRRGKTVTPRIPCTGLAPVF